MARATDVLDHFVSAVDDEQVGVYGVQVLVGDESADHRWRSDDRVEVYSISKGVSTLAAGIAVGEGAIGLDTTVAEALPALRLGDGVDSVTLRHLLTMTSGIDFEWFGHERVPWPDLAQEYLGRPSRGPGSVFQYTDVSTYTAMRMLATLVGDVRDWLVPRLFHALDIHNPQWLRCPLGFVLGGTGVLLRTEEMARIGRLLRDRGRWDGEQLVDAAWIDSMHGDWVETGDSDAGYTNYGLAAWQGPGDSWRLHGRYGQFIVVDEAQGAVITITGHEETRAYRVAELAYEALHAR